MLLTCQLLTLRNITKPRLRYFEIYILMFKKVISVTPILSI